MVEAFLFVKNNETLEFVQSIGNYDSEELAKKDILELYNSAFDKSTKVLLNESKVKDVDFVVNIDGEDSIEYIKIIKEK